MLDGLMRACFHQLCGFAGRIDPTAGGGAGRCGWLSAAAIEREVVRDNEDPSRLSSMSIVAEDLVAVLQFMQSDGEGAAQRPPPGARTRSAPAGAGRGDAADAGAADAGGADAGREPHRGQVCGLFTGAAPSKAQLAYATDALWEVDDRMLNHVTWTDFQRSIARNMEDTTGLEPARLYHMACYIMYLVAGGEAHRELWRQTPRGREDVMEATAEGVFSVHMAMLNDEAAAERELTALFGERVVAKSDLIDASLPFSRFLRLREEQRRARRAEHEARKRNTMGKKPRRLPPRKGKDALPGRRVQGTSARRMLSQTAR